MVKKAKVREWTTDYGMSKGHCASAENAQIAAMAYMIRNKQKRATIEGPHGAAARLYHNSFWGFTMVPAKGQKSNVIPFKKRA
jgi:hypothetical protein